MQMFFKFKIETTFIFLSLFTVVFSKANVSRCEEDKITVVLRLVESDQNDARIQPNFPNNPTIVTLGFMVLTLEDLQIEDMAFSLDIFLIQEWNDPRLKHNFEPYLDASTMIDKIWIPDTYFREATITDTRHQKQVEEKKSLVRIKPNGNVYYSTKVSLRLACAMDLKMFPVDVQHCNITIASYAYMDKELKYQWQNTRSSFYSIKGKGLSHYEIDPMRRETYVLKDEHGGWSQLKATITFRRKSSAFIPAMYFPCTVIVIVSWITFFIHPDHFPARTNLCAVSVLTIITLQGGLNSTLPKVSYIKVIDMYVLGCVLFVSGAFIEYAVVLLLKHKKNRMLKKKERSKLRRIKMTGDADLYKDEGKNINVMSKGAKSGWSDFYMKDNWPIVIDEYSRLMFPFAFVICNAVYWVSAMKYTHILVPGTD